MVRAEYRSGTERLFGGKVQQVVDGLREALGAGIALYDADLRWRYFARRDGSWSSHRAGDAFVPPLPGRCVVNARINSRWTLNISRSGRLHPDAEALAAWAVKKLADYLSEAVAENPGYPPIQGGGGTSGSAELGIPVSWLRRKPS
jgi:hypothetical protein